MNEILPQCDMLQLAAKGEVFVSPYYKELLEDHNLSKMKYLLLHSNGVLASAEKIRHYCEIVIGCGVILSIDAATEDTYKKIRRGGNFNKLMTNLAGVGSLRKSEILRALGLVFVVQEDNYKEMREIVRIAHDNHADTVIFIRLDNWGLWTEEEFEKMTLTDKNRQPTEKVKKELECIEHYEGMNVYFDQEQRFIRDLFARILNVN